MQVIPSSRLSLASDSCFSAARNAAKHSHEITSIHTANFKITFAEHAKKHTFAANIATIPHLHSRFVAHFGAFLDRPANLDTVSSFVAPLWSPHTQAKRVTDGDGKISRFALPF